MEGYPTPFGKSQDGSMTPKTRTRVLSVLVPSSGQTQGKGKGWGGKVELKVKIITGDLNEKKLEK